jgi:dTDP-4-dehydrorhamnose reductase
MLNPRGVVILGSTGMLGQALLREAERRRVPYVGLARGAPDNHAIDLTDDVALEEALRWNDGRTIINAAALTDLDTCEKDPAQAYALNTRLPSVLARHCQRTGRRLVQISTDHYYVGDTNRLHDEQSPVHLLNEYARTKYAGEAFAAACPESLVVRTNIVGLRGWEGKPTFVEWALQALRGTREFTAYEDVWASSIDVDLFAAALFDLIERGASGLLNVAARESTSKLDFIRALAEALSLPHAHCLPGRHAGRPGTPRANALGLDVARAEALLQRRLPANDEVIAALARTILGADHVFSPN